MQEMQFCIMKPKETAIRRGDPEEMDKLLVENKIKYGFMNPTYDMDDCRKVAESGFVELKKVILKNVTDEVFKGHTA